MPSFLAGADVGRGGLKEIQPFVLQGFCRLPGRALGALGGNVK
jgi:hypothetical protein